MLLAFNRFFEAGNITRDVHHSYQWNILGIAESYKSSPFDRSIDIQTAGERHGIVSHDTDSVTFHPSKTGDDVGSKILLGARGMTSHGEQAGMRSERKSS
jgi:hypothetical protein